MSALAPSRRAPRGPYQKIEKPYGFRVTIERNHRGLVEKLTFQSKTPARAAAVQAAGYKQGFLRLIEVTPLTRVEWNRTFVTPAK